MEKNKNKYIEVAYRLYVITDEKKELVEVAPSDKPFRFITGFGVALDAFEEAVEDLPKGDSFELALTPSQAYGDYSEERILHLDREIFTINGHFDHENIRKNAFVPLQNEDGRRFMGRVVDIADDKVTMDLNHPLAGKAIRFEGSIVENRDATNDEIQGMINRLGGEECDCGCDGDCQEDGHKHGDGCCGGHHHNHDGHCHCHG